MTQTAFAIFSSLQEAFEHHLGVRPDKVFLRHGNQSLTFKEVEERSGRIAASLEELGVERGNAVAVLMPNSLEHMLTLFACARLGAVQLPLNHEFNAGAIARLLEQMTPAVLIADVQFEELALASLEASASEAALVMSDVDGIGGRVPEQQRFEALLNAEPVPWVTSSLSDPFMLIMTSGTTAAAKAVEISHGFVLHIASEVVWHQEYSDEDVLFSPYPLFHGDAPMLTVMPGLVAGCTVAVGRKFSASGFWREIRNYGATVFDYMGAVLAILGKQEPRDNDRDNPVRLAWGGPAPSNWRELEERFDIKIREVYGATECCLPIWESPNEERRDGTAGKLCEHHELRIVDEAGLQSEPGTVGDVLVRSRVPHGEMTGYFHNSEATVSAWRGLWYRTGDRGSLSEDGYFSFAGRVKDIIRRRGRNIGAEEIESVALRWEGVVDVAAIATPSALTEDDIKIVVQGTGLSRDAYLTHLRENLPRYMVPRYIEFCVELPRTPTGKVDKNALRSRWRNETTFDTEDQIWLSTLDDGGRG